MTERWKATDPYGLHTLHIIDRATDYQRYVVCHNYRPENGWDWGNYFDDQGRAVECFLKKITRMGWIPRSEDEAGVEDNNGTV
jgi:hypothetical protein